MHGKPNGNGTADLAIPVGANAPGVAPATAPAEEARR